MPLNLNAEPEKRSSPCEETLKACDSALEAADQVIQAQDRQVQALEKAQEKAAKRIEELESQNESIWRNPAVMILLGVTGGLVIGGVVAR